MDIQKLSHEDGNIRKHVAEFSVSQGECVARALLKVWGKVQKLHHHQLITSDLHKETTATQTEQQKSENETRCKLLELQLRYIRKVVHDTHISSTSAENSVKLQPSAKLKNLEDKLQMKQTKLCEDCTDTKETKMTCTANSHPSQTFPKGRTLETEAKYVDDSCDPNKEVSNHYHLRLDDIPFILGTSTGASHSVIANVQNLISMMKSHNRGLCNSATAANKGGSRAGKWQRTDKHHLTLTKDELNVILQTLENELEILKKEENRLMKRHYQKKDGDKDIIEDKISRISHICSLLSKLTPSVQREVPNPVQRTTISSAVARNKERIAENRKFLQEVQKAKHVLQQDICWQ